MHNMLRMELRMIEFARKFATTFLLMYCWHIHTSMEADVVDRERRLLEWCRYISPFVRIRARAGVSMSSWCAGVNGSCIVAWDTLMRENILYLVSIGSDAPRIVITNSLSRTFITAG